MSVAAKWNILEDTTAHVPGLMVPPRSDLPYWTEQLLSEEEADRIYFSVISQYPKKELSRVYRLDGQGDEVNTDSRYTHYYDPINVGNFADIAARFNDAVNRCARKWWNCDAAPVYEPQILGYEERCHFRNHCDNSIWANGGWNRNDPQRDITALLYISECVPVVTRPGQYSGGEFSLTNIVDNGGKPITIRPRKGQFVAFPSHPVFRHQVAPVKRGYRVAVVNWWTAR